MGNELGYFQSPGSGCAIGQAICRALLFLLLLFSYLFLEGKTDCLIVFRACFLQFEMNTCENDPKLASNYLVRPLGFKIQWFGSV